MWCRLKRKGATPGLYYVQGLNKVCPKERLPVPYVKLLIDATTHHEALSFMEGYSRNNQIKLYPEDEQMMAFRPPKMIIILKEMLGDMTKC